MPFIRHFSLLQLLQRFRLEYHHEPLDLRQKLLTVPDQPVKIKFVDRRWLYPVSLLFVLVVSDGSFLTFFNSRTYTQSHTPTVVQGEGVDGTPSPLGFFMLQYLGVANGISKNVGLGKFWQDLEISEAFLISLEVSFLHGLFLLFMSLETFYQRVSGSDFLTRISASRRVSDFTIRHP